MRDRKPQKYNTSVYQAFTMILQFSLNMIVPIVLCMLLGYYIDKWAHTSFWVIIFFFIGALAGGRNVYKMAKGVFDHDKK